MERGDTNGHELTQMLNDLRTVIPSEARDLRVYLLSDSTTSIAVAPKVPRFARDDNLKMYDLPVRVNFDLIFF